MKTAYIGTEVAALIIVIAAQENSDVSPSEANSSVPRSGPTSTGKSKEAGNAERKIRTNYIFVDYENVQNLDLALIVGKPIKVFLIIGKRRKTLPCDLAKQVHQCGEQVEWIESEGASPNALDLVLAYRLGMQAKADPQGYFHVLAKDKDYDALIQHLRSNGILASRDEAFGGIYALVPFKNFSLEQRVDWVVERLRKNNASRPKKKKSLFATAHAVCRKELSETEVQQIVSTMQTRKLIEFTQQDGVVYKI